MRRQVAWDEKASAGETERVPARRIVDSAGIRGPEPRVGLRVTMSADGRAVCAAHGFFCPDGDGEGTVRAAMGGSVAVDWDCGKRGDYLVGQYNQYMLLVAPCGGGGGAVPGEVPAHTHRAPADGAASADLELSRPWWKGTPHVAAFTPGSTKPANGRLVRVAVRVDGEPNEILVPTGYILPPEPHFRLEAGEIVRIRGLVNAPQYNGMLATRVTSGGSDASGGKVCVELLATSKQLQVSLEKIEPIPGADVDGEVLRVCPWWNSSQVVRIQGTGTRLDGASALVVGFEVVTEVEQTVHGLRANAASAPQRLPLSSVVAHSYHLAMQCTEGQDLQQSYRLMASALVQARLVGDDIQQAKCRLWLFKIARDLGRMGSALAHLQEAHATLHPTSDTATRPPLPAAPTPDQDEPPAHTEEHAAQAERAQLRLMVLQNFGELYGDLGDWAKAKFYLLSSFERARASGFAESECKAAGDAIGRESGWGGGGWEGGEEDGRSKEVGGRKGEGRMSMPRANWAYQRAGEDGSQRARASEPEKTEAKGLEHTPDMYL